MLDCLVSKRNIIQKRLYTAISDDAGLAWPALSDCCVIVGYRRRHNLCIDISKQPVWSKTCHTDLIHMKLHQKIITICKDILFEDYTRFINVGEVLMWDLKTKWDKKEIYQIWASPAWSRLHWGPMFLQEKPLALRVDPGKWNSLFFLEWCTPKLPAHYLHFRNFLLCISIGPTKFSSTSIPVSILPHSCSFSLATFEAL